MSDFATSHPDLRMLPLKGEWVITHPLLLLPFGLSRGYALRGGNVVGLKLEFGRDSFTRQDVTPAAIIDILTDFVYLERLVLYCHDAWELPPDLLKLPKLNSLWVGGRLTKLPIEILHADFVFDAETRYDQPLEVLKKHALEGFKFGSATESPSNPFPKKDDPLRIEEVRLRQYLQDHKEVEEDFLKSLATRGALFGVFINSTNLEDPPYEIARKGTIALHRYFAERSTGSLPLNECKVLLVGNGAAGKTSLVKSIFGEAFNSQEEQTHGINIRSNKVHTSTGTEVKLNFWDFGGQEIMHATHQFFLSKRSIYILVLDGRKEEDPEYWLQHIQSFGGESPILVVLNKIDAHPSFDVNRRFLLSKYPGIVGFFRISCATGAGISEFRSHLVEILKDVPLIQTQWPRKWFAVKQRLESSKKAYLSLTEYKAVCSKASVMNPQTQTLLVEFLRDLGVVLHFPDFALRDTHVLDPRWVTEAVYRILNSEILALQKGVLALSQLPVALAPRKPTERPYPEEKHRYIVDLMLKFELCYMLGNEAILVPDLLEIQEPRIMFEADDMLRFIFQYAYLPKSIIPRFIVRMHKDIKDNSRWRTGVLLADSSFDATALVRADEHAKRIYVSVIGSQKRDYFAVIRKVIIELTASFEKLPITEYVPLPDLPDMLLDYQELLGYEAAGKQDFFVGRLRRTYDLQTLLNGIEPETKRLVHSGPTINVQGNYYESNVTMGSEFLPIAQEADRMGHEPERWEKIVVYATGFLFLGLVGYLLIRNEQIADKNLVVTLRIILSLVVAVFGATVPGMLKIDYSARGLSIRAMGALALFVLTFLLTPKVL